MKDYREMADSVLSRIEAYETAKREKRRKRRRAAPALACLSLAALIGIGVFLHHGLPGLPASGDPLDAPVAGENSGEPAGEGVFIPAVQLPEPGEGSADMIGVLVYKGAVYTQAAFYYEDEAQTVRALLGERLGRATGTLDEWSAQEEYAVEFASTYMGDVYTVRGYSPDFRLCVDLGGGGENTGSELVFLERVNGIELTDGEDFFGDRLRLQGRVVSAAYQLYEAFDGTNFEELEVSGEQLEAFLRALYAGRFVDVCEEHPAFFTDPSRRRGEAILRLALEDGTAVRLYLYEDGYVGYDGLGQYLVKMPGEAFASVFQVCQ